MNWSYFWHSVIGLLTLEVWLWGVLINQHALWLKSAAEIETMCYAELWPRVYVASVMATTLSLCSFVYWLVGWWTWGPEGTHHTQWLVAALQLSHIHFFAILARCTGIEVEHWPSLSRLVSKYLHNTGVCRNGKFFSLEDGCEHSH